mgnify:CR=1 FL=1
MKKNIAALLITILLSLPGFSQEKFGPTPTKEQLAWHDKEFYLFMHFGPNTFTDLEWGHGSEDPNVFNPTAIDCNQWASITKAAGAKGIIITAKHHDGFSLWPSKYSNHTVKESKWMDGKGDVLKMLSEACKKQGIEMGVYISPWDRNHPDYGTPKYNEVYINTMKELLTGYGKFFELWWDGANGEGPNGKKQQYDFTRFKDSALSYQPQLVIFSDIGPHVRWVGNENGIIGDPTVTVVIFPDVERLSFLPGTTSKTSCPNSWYSRLREFIAVLSPPLFGPYIFAMCAMRVMMHAPVACPYEQLKPLCRDRKVQNRRRSRYEFGPWRMHSAPSLNAYPQN